MSTVGSLSVLLQLIPKDFDKGFNLLGRMKTLALGVVSVGALRGIASFAEKVTETATHLNSLSHSIGMTVEQGQLFGYLAEASGSNLKELATGVSMFERNLAKLANGTASPRLIKQLAMIGIHSAEAKDALSGPDGLQRQLLAVSDVVKNSQGTKNQIPVATAFQQNFGARAGRAAYADFERGSAGIKELFAKRASVGLINQHEVDNLRDLGIAAKTTTASLTQIGTILLARMAPALIKMAEAAQAWIAENKDIISGVFEAAFNALAFAFEAIGTAISTVVSVLAFFVDLIQQARDGSLGAQIALIGIAVVLSAVLVPIIVGSVIPALVTMGTILVTEIIPALITMAIVGWAAIAPFLPIILLVAAIAVGIALIVHYWDKVGTYVKLIAKWLIPIVGLVLLIRDHWDAVKNAIGSVWEVLKKVGGAIKDFFVDMAHDIVQMIKDVFEYIANLPVIKQVLWAINKLASIGNGADTTDAQIANAKQSLEFQANLAKADGRVDANGQAYPSSLVGPGQTLAPSLVAPTTINIYGVKDATGATGAISRSADEIARRNTAAALAMGLGEQH